MANDQSYDPRVSIAGDREAVAVSLEVDAITGASGGGEAGALSVNWAGTVGHGEDLTLTATSGAFPGRSHESQRHFQEGDRLWLSGVEQTTSESALSDGDIVSTSTMYPYRWPSSSVIADRSTNPENVNFSYNLGDVNGGIREPAGQGGSSPIPKTTNRGYCSWLEKQSVDIDIYRTADYSSITGTFEDAGRFEIDEELQIVTKSGDTSTGRLIYIDYSTQEVAFILDERGPEYGSAEIRTPGTFTGVTSGAVMTLANKSGYISATKRHRFECNSFYPDEFQLTIGNTVSFATRAGEFRPGGSRPRALKRPVEWGMITAYIGSEGTDVYASVRAKTAEEYYGPHPLGQDPEEVTAGINLGPHVTDYAGDVRSGHRFHMTNLVYDDEPARVMLGDAENWGDCTKYSDCLIKSWSGAGVTIRQNHSQFADTDAVYVFVFNEKDERLSDTGLEIRSAS